MTLFWIGAALLVALAWAMLWPVWRAWRGVAKPGVGDAPSAGERGPRSAHLVVLGEQLAALDADLAAGRLDAAQHLLARSEVQRRMLDESDGASNAGKASIASTSVGIADAPPAARSGRKTLAFVVLAVPLFAFALYGLLGSPAGLNPPPGAGSGGAAEITPEALDKMLATLEQRLDKPSANLASDLQGWTLLARSYAGLQRFPAASRAYARASALAPNDAQLLADHADVLALVQGRSMQGEPDRLVAKALQIEPRNLKALALAGSSAFERKDFAAARGYWQQALGQAPPGSEFAAGLERSLSELGGANGGAGSDASPPSQSTQTAQTAQTAQTPIQSASAPADAARIRGRVSLAPALAARALPTDTVFIFARAADGPRMPLAILKRTVAELPFEFTLDDSMAMSPQMKLSKFASVVVGARVSRSGNAMPQPGDLRGESAPTATRSDDLQLVIDSVQP